MFQHKHEAKKLYLFLFGSLHLFHRNKFNAETENSKLQTFSFRVNKRFHSTGVTGNMETHPESVCLVDWKRPLR